MWHSRPRLCIFLLLPYLLVSGFPAVGNFRQELSDLLDFDIGPDLGNSFPLLNGFRRRNLPLLEIFGKSRLLYSDLLCGFTSRVSIHLISIVDGSMGSCQIIFAGSAFSASPW